jgi:hypothetical protein
MIPNRGKPARLWANGTDQLLAGRRFVGLFDDLEMPRPSVLRNALATIASSGPHTRLALTPRPGKRIWRYDPEAPLPVHELPDAVANEGSAAVLQYIRRRSGCRHPMEFHVSQRHFALDLDHGLGDGRFALELISALFAHARGDSTPWVTDDDTPLALPRALFHTFGLHPTRARRVWNYAAGLRSAASTDLDAAPDEVVTWSPSFAVAIAHVNADAESAVNEWRRVNAGKSGSASVWLYIIRQALHAAGLPMTEGVIFAFDCRRYLPKGRTANANFIIGLNIPVPVDEPLLAVVTRLREITASGVPLAGMAAVSARALLAARRWPMVPANRLIDAQAEVMYTDMGIMSLLDDAPWSSDKEPSGTGLLDPGGPNGVTILNTRIGNTRNISISFHDNVFDRRVIDRAVDYLKNPMQFLASDVRRRA